MRINYFIPKYAAIAFLALGIVSILPISTSHAADKAKDSANTRDRYQEVYDPYEEVNRAIYSFHDTLARAILRPVAKGYRYIVPKQGREGIRNILHNLAEPVTFLNALLQGDFAYAGTSFWRFTINSTLGAAGIMDVASSAGMPERTEDFGQTLGHYGTGPGAYIMLPFFGPSSVRDAGGSIVDAFSSPWVYTMDGYSYAAYKATDIIDSREETLDITIEIDRTSLDPYAALRSLYLQSREDRVRNGTPRAPL